VDSIKIQHIHNTVNISDSVRFEDDITLPYSFKKSQGESFSLFSSTFFVDNSRTNFEVGNMVEVFSEVWFKIDGEPYHISRNLTKEYRRLRGVYTP
jgi:hypothetical protein